MTEYEPIPTLTQEQLAAPEGSRFLNLSNSRFAALVMSGALLVGACASDSGSDEVVAAPSTTQAETTTTEVPTTTTTAPEPEPWFSSSPKRYTSEEGWVLEVKMELDEPVVSPEITQPGLVNLDVTIPGHLEVRNSATRDGYVTPEFKPFIAEIYYANDHCVAQGEDPTSWIYPGLEPAAGNVNDTLLCANNSFVLDGDGYVYPSLAPGESWESNISGNIEKTIVNVPESRVDEYEELLQGKPAYVAVGSVKFSEIDFKSVTCNYSDVIQLYDGEGRAVPFEDFVDFGGNCSIQ